MANNQRKASREKRLGVTKAEETEATPSGLCSKEEECVRKGLLYLGILAVLLSLVLLVGCTTQETPKTSSTTTTTSTSTPTSSSSSSPSSSSVSEPDVPLKVKTVWAGTYKDDIQPILDRYCVECHGPKKAENDLRLDSYEGVTKGTKFGPVVVPGSSSTSSLVFVIDGTASKEIQMPHEGRKLSKNRIENIKAWIDAGAKQ